MSDTIIKVENLGKKYIIGHQQEERSRYVALRDVLANSAKSLWKSIRNPKTTQNNKREEFWALKDVSFEVKQGEAIGIIGRNGAGKSTLLKILSRITEPTTGRITLGGRVASLLEVGTGFHPELTGRENIYLNGAILGMARAEIKRKFDEIVAFAEVEKFLDTPVKRYSSGMYVRLAFAVAAHLEPEILVVDEVLAVGDAAFQKKCLGKMDDVAKKEGRTVLFVSHNMAAIRNLCSRGLVLKQGQINTIGSVETIIEKYLEDDDSLESLIIWNEKNAPVCDQLRFLKTYILDQNNQLTSRIDTTETFYIVLEYETYEPILGLRIGLLMQNNEGVIICGSNNPNIQHKIKPAGKYICKCLFPSYTLNSGQYAILFGADSLPAFELMLMTSYCIKFTVEDTYGHGYLKEKMPGVLRPKILWDDP